MITKSLDVVSKARAQLLLDTRPSAAFLATLAMQLQLIPTYEIDTFGVDGTSMAYNPDFAASLPQPHLQGVVAHEVLHCALLHPFRRGNREPYTYNVAADHVVNLELKEWGYELPKDCYCDPQYKGLSVEQVYSRLMVQPKGEKKSELKPQEGSGAGSGIASQGTPHPQPGGSSGGASTSSKPQPGNGAGSGAGNGPAGNPGSQSSNAPSNAVGPKNEALPGCSSGSFSDPPSPKGEAGAGAQSTPEPKTAEDWSIMAEQAALAARAAGFMPGALDGMLKASRQPSNDWRQELREYITRSVTSDTSWARPNRRFVGSGLILPGAIQESIGKIVVTVDTSGSTQGAMLESFSNELRSILEEVQPESTTVLYADTSVRRADTFERGDDFELRFTGGGGTIFQPAFDYVEQENLNPLCMIYITDLFCGDKPKSPEYPVIWAVPAWINHPVPFEGARVNIEMD